ncbi:hypothetical protein HMPREF1531_00823 [Propionibacterium sp. oral taxon 192 str. F0372]|uniref:B12-binding domain-containing radical SAM protein n=1 Tax=Propionibacterium sp. oral taxon 192 TaxID=671222 RepID=UPI000352E941|nr:B12-binding domain-containing radical SAM protein [Propionibacterium sp. oral taxon 192]EPH06174.1 hypothetical protein HMPREF1531_00823 [Propionibacterium sp. oral taxon 192 str. F0372]
MKVLLISTNKIRVPRPALPIGMAYISAALKQAGHEVRVLDLLWEAREIQAVRKCLAEEQFDVVGIAVRNLDNLTYVDPIFFAPLIEKIVMCVKKYSSAKVVIGGTGFSVEPMAFFEYARPDFGVCGAGESSIVMLIDRLQKEGDLSTVPGLCYVDCDGNYVQNHPEFSFNERTLVPDRSVYDRRYFRTEVSAISDLTRESQPAIETLQTKRGCNLTCSYCIIRKTEGKKIRYRAPEEVVSEIRRAVVENPAVKEFELVDATFNSPPDYAFQICEEMIRKDLDVPWYCQLSPNTVTPELLDVMAAAGCIRVDLGTDAFTDEALSNLNKGFDMSKVVQVDQYLTNSPIEHTHCVFLGGPGETVAALRESLDISERFLNPSQIYANLGIRILSGTKLYRQAVEAGILESGQSVFTPAYYVEPEIRKEAKILELVRERYLNHKNWYLWWGLRGQSLSERANLSDQAVLEMRREYGRTMSGKPRLVRAYRTKSNLQILGQSRGLT